MDARAEFKAFNDARLRQVRPEPFHAFTQRIEVQRGEAVPVTRTAVGDFARDREGNIVWVEV